MRFLSVLALPLAFVGACASCQVPKPAPFPLQMEARVPFDPTAFPSEGRNWLFYELHLTNFTPSPISLECIEIVDPDSALEPIAVFKGGLLQSMMSLVTASSPTTAPQIPGGEVVVVFVSISFDRRARIPPHLLHRIVTSGGTLDGAVMGTHHMRLQVLGPPVKGAIWKADDGPGNESDNHRRRGLHVFAGNPVISARYAIDWQQEENGSAFSGHPKDRSSYFSYGKPVFAVARARVVSARDGLPENTPGHGDAFHPAVPITVDTLGGNFITLDLGAGEYAYYFHLQPGSVRVKAGDHVRRGQLLARIGASGDAREPHLHFEVTTASEPFVGEGVPYVIDQYTITPTNGGVPRVDKQELPRNKAIVSFRSPNTQ